MIDAAGRLGPGVGLAEFFVAHATVMPLQFTEQFARRAVAEATVELDRSTQLCSNPAMGALPT